MFPGLNGDGRKLATVAALLASDVNGDAGRAERAFHGIYLRMLWRNEVRRLVVARDAAGGPEECEGLPGKMWIVSQDGIRVPVKTVEFRWTA